LDQPSQSEREGTCGDAATVEVHRPRRGEIAAIFAAALALRIIVAVLAMQRMGASPSDFAYLRDGDSYIRVGKAMRGETEALKPFDMRVFPGYPALIAAAETLGFDGRWAALGLNWLAAAAAAALCAVLFVDRRIGWAMAVLTPSYLMYSTLVMSEATLAAFMTGGAAAAAGGAYFAGGLLLGYAGLIRPVAAFAAAGIIAWALSRRKYAAALSTALSALAVVLAGAALLALWRGDAFEGVRLYAADQRAYGGEPLTWPFKSLIMTPLRQETAGWKIAYIWGHVAIVLGGCVLAASRFRSKAGARGRGGFLAVAAPVWLWSNTVFILCIGAHWGFHEFHRFMAPALPPLFWAYGRWLPGRWFYWAMIAPVSVVLAVWGAAH